MLAFPMEVIMHQARFVGVRNVKRYFNRPIWTEKPFEVCEAITPIPFEPWKDDNLLWEGELSVHILQTGDFIYLSELKETVKVTGVRVSNEGVYTYLTSYEIEQLEDDITPISKQEAEDAYAKYLLQNPPEPELESGLSILTRIWKKLFRRSEH